MESAESAMLTILEAVATHEGCDISALSPLYETVDPEALDTLSRAETVEIQFTYRGYDIYVSSPEEVTIRS